MTPPAPVAPAIMLVVGLVIVGTADLCHAFGVKCTPWKRLWVRLLQFHLYADELFPLWLKPVVIQPVAEHQPRRVVVRLSENGSKEGGAFTHARHYTRTTVGPSSAGCCSPSMLNMQ